jgi:hypothetical protein
MTKTISPPIRTPRLSVPIDAETLLVFERLAKAANQSTGKAVAQWLLDTVEAANFMATTMEKARQSPRIVVRELQAYTLGLQDELSSVMQVVKLKGEQERAARAEALAVGGPARGGATAKTSPIPPSCNTGGKLPKTPKITNALKPGFPLPPAKVQAYADTNGKPPKAAK